MIFKKLFWYYLFPFHFFSDCVRAPTEEEVKYLGEALSKMLVKKNPNWGEVDQTMTITFPERRDWVMKGMRGVTNIKTRVRKILEQNPSYRHINVVSSYILD